MKKNMKMRLRSMFMDWCIRLGISKSICLGVSQAAKEKIESSYGGVKNLNTNFFVLFFLHPLPILEINDKVFFSEVMSFRNKWKVGQSGS